MPRSLSHMLPLALLVATAGCAFTGVERTERITEKEVQRVIGDMEARRTEASLTPWADSLSAWRVGKRFYVTDDRAAMLFARSDDYDLDTMRLAGRTLTYRGMAQSPSLLDGSTVDLRFTDGHHTLVYHTGRRGDDLPASLAIPLLIDLDMVAHVAGQIAGRQAYVKTPIWYDPATEAMTHGRQLVQVTIAAVEPGNKVMPLKVTFVADRGDTAFVWMAAPGDAMHGRDFDALFALDDPRRDYPEVSDRVWTLIQHGDVTQGMTKQECRLAKGAPMRTAYRPDQGGMHEYWYYDGGAYLHFEDGTLKDFRK